MAALGGNRTVSLDRRELHLTLPRRTSIKRNAREKHSIQQQFHAQLKDLWTRPPLSGMTRLLDPGIRGR